MASKFQIWVDNEHLDNVQSYASFENDSQRKAGFTPGTPASSVRVNSALRQANLIACALMEIVDPTGTKDLRANVNDIKSLINSYLNTTLTTSNSTNVTTNINGKAINTIFETNGTTVKNATNAGNVSGSINGKAISSIFENNGTTVKNATRATNADVAGDSETLQGQDFNSDSINVFSGEEISKVVSKKIKHVFANPLQVGYRTVTTWDQDQITLTDDTIIEVYGDFDGSSSFIQKTYIKSGHIYLSLWGYSNFFSGKPYGVIDIVISRSGDNIDFTWRNQVSNDNQIGTNGTVLKVNDFTQSAAATKVNIKRIDIIIE